MNLSTDSFQFSQRIGEDTEILRYKKVLDERRASVPIWEKKCLTMEEAAEYSSIGINQLYKLVKAKECPFVVVSGNQYLIAREMFDRYLMKCTKIETR